MAGFVEQQDRDSVSDREGSIALGAEQLGAVRVQLQPGVMLRGTGKNRQ